MRTRVTGLALCLALCLALEGCRDRALHGGAGVGDACSASADCAAPLSCASGKCALPRSLQACAPGTRRCDGSDLLACDADGLHEALVATCADGCSGGACLTAACAEGARRCGASGVEQCERSPAGMLAWTLSQACPAGCDPARTACAQLACRPLDARCAPGLQVCAGDGGRWEDRPCASGSLCRGGACVVQRCVPLSLSCNGGVLVRCDAAGGGFGEQTPCPAGCANGACVPAVCAPGAARCSTGGDVEGCRPDGSGWSLSQACSGASCRVLGPGRASCAQAVCSPLARRCGGAGVEVCAGDGSKWTPAGTCAGGCAGGTCLAPPAGCAAGAVRCDGAIVERCDGSRWQAIAECLGACASGGVCSGPSCTAAFTLSVPLPSCAGTTCKPPADGVSTLLAVTSVLVDASGSAMPDGTLVTVAATGGAQIAAGDADPATPGVQVRTSGGRADFAVRAPPASAIDPASGRASVILSATVAGSTTCAATAQLAFAPSTGPLFVADDFTTDTFRDVAATTADWRAADGLARALSSEAGDGSDGPLTVPPRSTLDLTAQARPGGSSPFAATARVTSVGASFVVVEGAGAAGFAPGDEALLVELQGAGTAMVAAAGAWELLTVAAAANGQVAFTGPVAGSYGQAPGSSLAGERVVLQRVPHFTNVTVPAGAAITASAWDGQRGGVIAFRASGVVSVAGSIRADALGYRGGDAGDAARGQGGESFGGLAQESTAASANLGGGSGGYGCGDANHLWLLDTWWGSAGSYGTAGASTCSGAGVAFGAPNLARIFLGSGSGSQAFSSHQACTPSSCPGEAIVAHGAANLSATGECKSGNCADTLSACARETAPHAAASLSNAGTCGSGNCSDTLNACAPETVTFAAAALPCTTSACNATFNACSAYDTARSGFASCSASCSGLVRGYSCNIDGCNSAAGSDASGYGCNYSWNGGSCGYDGTTGTFSGCGSNASNCNHGSNDICTNNCNFFGGNCDCYFKCFGCATCTGCRTNPGCSTNPGCNTNPGCSTCASCDMTRGGTDCAQQCPNLWQGRAAGGRGGGIVFIAAATVDLSGGGRISANGGLPAAGSFGGSGGSIFLRVNRLQLAPSGVQISALGAAGGGEGRVRLDRAAGDDPVGRQQVSPVPLFRGAFSLPVIQSRTLATSASSATLAVALDSGAPSVAWSISPDGGATWVAATPGVALAPFAAQASDLRFRAQLFPQGSAAVVTGVVWLFQ